MIRWNLIVCLFPHTLKLDQKDHSAFASAYKCSNPENTDKLRDLYLNFHNDARRRVAKGKEPNRVGTLNPAKNMYKLVGWALLNLLFFEFQMS